MLRRLSITFVVFGLLFCASLLVTSSIQAQGLVIEEQDFTGDGTLDVRVDNGIMWIQINRDDPLSVKGIIDAGGISGENNLLDASMYADGMADQARYWRTQDFTVELVEANQDRAVIRILSVDTANGKEISRENTVTLDAEREYAWIDYVFTNTGSSSFLYDQVRSHIHNGAHLGGIKPVEKYDIDAYINGIGTIGLPSLGWWRSYAPDASAPYAVMFTQSTGDAITYGLKLWSYPIHQAVAYYTGASSRIEPHVDFMATAHTMAVGESTHWQGVVAFHEGGVARGAEIYAAAEEPAELPSPEPIWCEDFESYAPGASIAGDWVLSGNISSIADPNHASGGNQSLKMYGRTGACWGAVADKLLEISFPLTVDLAVRNGTENLSGCHPYRASLGLRTGPVWQDQGLPLWMFLENGDLRITLDPAQPVFSGYDLETWYNVRVETRLTDDVLFAKYWVDGQYLGEFSQDYSDRDWIHNIRYVDIAAQEGTVWFDDVCISSGAGQEEEFATIAGTVTAGAVPQEGVTVVLVDNDGVPVSAAMTASEGTYEFADVANGSYTVEVDVPLGFVPVTEPAVDVTVAGMPVTVDFELAPAEAGKLRNVYWWKTYLADLRDDGPRTDKFTVEDVNGWGEAIFDHFYDRLDGYGIQIEGVTHAGDAALTFEDICYTLLDVDHSTYEAKVEYNMLPNLLNIACGNMSQLVAVTDDGATAGQAITYFSAAYAANAGWVPPEYDRRDMLIKAYRGFRDMSMGRDLRAGIVPLSTPMIMYKTGQYQLPASFALNQNYPNPFNPATEISFALPMAGDVTLEIYNVVGQRIATLVDGEQYPAGSHAITWDAAEFASGMYLYRLQAGEFVETKKMIMLK